MIDESDPGEQRVLFESLVSPVICNDEITFLSEFIDLVCFEDVEAGGESSLIFESGEDIKSLSGTFFGLGVVVEEVEALLDPGFTLFEICLFSEDAPLLLVLSPSD